MADPCALCGDDAPESVPVPSEWSRYLHQERALDPPAGSFALPLCHDCSRQVDVLRERYQHRRRLDDDEQAAVKDAVHGMLDAIDLNLVREEWRG